jgi:hypothetical protein
MTKILGCFATLANAFQPHFHHHHHVLLIRDASRGVTRYGTRHISSSPSLHFIDRLMDCNQRRHSFLESKDVDDDEEDTIPTNNNIENITQQSSPIKNNDNIKNQKQKPLLYQIGGALFTLFSYCIQFLGAVFTIGLILNLFGYAYSFDLKHGFEVDTLENRRREVQFEREIIREEREDMLLLRERNGLVQKSDL